MITLLVENNFVTLELRNYFQYINLILILIIKITDRV